MQVPAATHPAWKKLLTGNSTVQFEFLAIKMLIGRLRIIVGKNASMTTMNAAVEEIRSVLIKNQNLPKVQRDIERIFGGGLS